MGIHPVTIVVFVAMLATGLFLGVGLDSVAIGAAVAVLAVLFFIAFRVARQWQKAVILRMGRYLDLKGPGFFYILPFIDTVPYWIDLRTVTTPLMRKRRLPKTAFRWMWMPSSSGGLLIPKRRLSKLRITGTP